MVESLLKVKYAMFLKNRNASVVKNATEEVYSFEKPNNVTELDNNAIDNENSKEKVSSLMMSDAEEINHPEVYRDLSGDTRVNYARGHQRNTPNSNSEVEVFDWDLIKEDEKKNSGPVRRFESIRNTPDIVDGYDSLGRPLPIRDSSSYIPRAHGSMQYVRNYYNSQNRPVGYRMPISYSSGVPTSPRRSNYNSPSPLRNYGRFNTNNNNNDLEDVEVF